MGHPVRFASFGGRCQGYLAVPEAGHGPGVVVVQEWWGLVPHIESVCDRLAAAGYVALAPDHYRGVSTTEPDEAAKLMMALQVESVGLDLAGAAEYLLTRDDVDGDGIGVVGFCMGGGLALLGPTVYRRIVAASAFYPAMPWESYHPDWARYSGKEALVHLAQHDDPSTPARVGAYRHAIEAAGGRVTVVDYPGTAHAFFNDARPEVYDGAAATAAWDRTLDLFARRLG
jgi:carboxymethylenebutenolidase